mmetsp:Transcript_23339/g.61282  ORF Transcript_23339/g.61282 Transcript_23339/m.61282 type:complete len:243 (-) Transcript_23339:371-1099(-)
MRNFVIFLLFGYFSFLRFVLPFLFIRFLVNQLLVFRFLLSLFLVLRFLRCVCQRFCFGLFLIRVDCHVLIFDSRQFSILFSRILRSLLFFRNLVAILLFLRILGRFNILLNLLRRLACNCFLRCLLLERLLRLLGRTFAIYWWHFLICLLKANRLLFSLGGLLLLLFFLIGFQFLIFGLLQFLLLFVFHLLLGSFDIFLPFLLSLALHFLVHLLFLLDLLPAFLFRFRHLPILFSLLLFLCQ